MSPKSKIHSNSRRIRNMRLADIDLIVYDFDGVMTDNKVFLFEDGREAVVCNRSDGLAVSVIKALDIPQVILSTETNAIVMTRAKKLGIEAIRGLVDKKAVLIDYCRRKKYDIAKTVYVGNDINDLEAMKVVGIPVAPSDASEEVKNVARIITEAKGGQGVIRELLSKLKR